MFKNKTESNDLKKVEAVVITNFIEDKVKSFSDAEVYINDDYDSEQDKVIGFRSNVCG